MTDRSSLALASALALATTALGCALCAPAFGTPAGAATRGYIYGYPIVLMEETSERASGADRICGFDSDPNTFTHVWDIPDFQFRAVVRPNVDTLYSSAFLDLSDGPVRLTIPPYGDRYVLMALYDAWSNNIAGPGTPTDAGAGGTYYIAGPDHTGFGDDTLDVIDSPTNLVWLIGRTEVRGDSDVAAVNALQSAYELTLADGSPVPVVPDVPPCIPLDQATAPPEAVDSLEPMDFLARLDRLLATQGPLPGDDEILDDLAEIGVGPRATTSLDDLGTLDRARVAAGVAVAKRSLSAGLTIGTAGGGWAPDPTDIPLGEYDQRYYVRAAVAQVGFGANKAEYAVYQNTATDSLGRTLNGDDTYTLTFDTGDTPPVDAFWSVTAYDSDGYLIETETLRYAVGSNTGLVPDVDGTVTITISAEAPTSGPQANWLPVAAGEDFELTLRMYAPQDPILEATWTAPDVVRER